MICTLAGIAGLGVCLFPCSATTNAFVGTFAIATATSGLLHNISAAIFFVLLSYTIPAIPIVASKEEMIICFRKSLFVTYNHRPSAFSIAYFRLKINCKSGI